MSLIFRILSYYRPFLGRIMLALGLLGIATALNLLKPWPLKFVVDVILRSPGGGIVLPFLPGEWSLPSALSITCGEIGRAHV